MGGTRFVIVLALLPTLVVHGVTFPNSITDEPLVHCSQGELSISVSTSDGLPAKIFAKGNADDPQCAFGNVAEATFPLSKCNMDRVRQIEPRGVQYSVVLIVQLHPLFITKVDRAYHVKCFYMEGDKLLTAGLQVSMLTTVDSITASHSMPQCVYSLHIDSPNGPLAKFANVGDMVWHKWDCPSDVYGMLVHSCFVKDKQGNRIMILDELGCGIDQYVMMTPEYSADLSTAQQQTHVFKFADRLTVAFQCSIKLCFRDGGGCQGITPPQCGGGASTVGGQLVIDEGGRTETNSAAATPPSVSPPSEPQLAVLAEATTGSSPLIVTGMPQDMTRDQLMPLNNASTRGPSFPTPPPTDVMIEGELSQFSRRLHDVGVIVEETDVVQQLVVLDVDQSTVLADALTRHPPRREPTFWPTKGEVEYNQDLVCLSSAGFGVVMSALVLLLLCSALAVTLACRRQSGTRAILKYLESDSSSMSATLSRATSRTDVMARI